MSSTRSVSLAGTPGCAGAMRFHGGVFFAAATRAC
jgi:hypothetical protein